MELDKQFIVRGDFSSARRGYDPDEVDRHLREIAEAVDDLKRERRQPKRTEPAATSSIAGAAADQVRAIVEAAERSAAEIEASATEEADRLTGEATHQAEQERNTARGEAERVKREAEAAARETRERAEAEAAQHVEGVREATAGMRDRAAAVESDLGGLVDQLRATVDSVVESVRNSAGSVEAELESIQAGLAEVRDAAPPEDDSGVDIGAGQATKATATLGTDEPTLAHEVVDGPDTELDADEEYEDVEAVEEGAPATAEELPLDDEDIEAEEDDLPADDEVSAGDDAVDPATDADAEIDSDVAVGTDADDEEPDSGEGDSAEGARLIALNMALNGTPRAETARYLEENFDLRDQDTILDEVYARVGG